MGKNVTVISFSLSQALAQPRGTSKRKRDRNVSFEGNQNVERDRNCLIVAQPLGIDGQERERICIKVHLKKVKRDRNW